MTKILTPTSVEEAVEMLSASESATPLAGGTALQMRRRRGAFAVDALVDLRRIPGLDRVEVDGDRLTVGPLVTHRRMETDPVIARHAPLLPIVYSQIANVRVRNVATVGGNLADADHRVDPPGALGVLGAEVELVSPEGRRTIPVTELFAGLGTTVLRRDEILAAVHVPRTPPLRRCTFLKLKSLGRNDWPCVSVAATLTTTVAGGRTLAVGITAVSPVPIYRVHDVTGLTAQDAIDSIDAVVDSAADPISDLRGSAHYKRRVLRVTLADAVRPLLEDGGIA